MNRDADGADGDDAHASSVSWRRPTSGPVTVAFAAALLALSSPSGWTAEPCRIEVVEAGSGWPVPLVELRTLNHMRFVTDNAGVIAFDLPDLMGRETWFDVIGNGYDVPKDGFGMRGVRLTPEPGKTLKVEVHRSNIAKRLGRLTGGGLFAESQKLGRELDWRESGILGCDTVENARYHGRLFWLWGDTIVPRYPLGIFDSIGATTSLQPLTSFEPPLRPRCDYFADDQGAPRAVAKMPGDGPTWVSGCLSLRDRSGAERLVGAYVKVHAQLDIYQSGLCAWNDAASRFEQLRVLWTKSASTPTRTPGPEGHAILWKDPAGQEWALFGDPFPKLRCPATFEAWQDPSTWETLQPQETLASASDGKPVKPHAGAIAWNPWRKRWVTVFEEAFGKPSVFGEVWYAEADAPAGPWGPAVKILSHENYTFYNPTLHPEFTPPDSPILLFEGTYTAEFANHPPITPRYNYNQILYRLDLDDPALAPAHTGLPPK
jgi:hypothetical protein